MKKILAKKKKTSSSSRVKKSFVSTDGEPWRMDRDADWQWEDEDKMMTTSDSNRRSKNKEEENDVAWRTSFLIEYHGEADIQDVDPQCQQDTNTTVSYSIEFPFHLFTNAAIIITAPATRSTHCQKEKKKTYY
mgnify:CR=1 FL=1